MAAWHSAGSALTAWRINRRHEPSAMHPTRCLLNKSRYCESDDESHPAVVGKREGVNGAANASPTCRGITPEQ